MVNSNTGSEQATGKTIEPEAGIAEKVRFWQEQDRINQVLIPRVIHLHKLLTDHIKENDNLPEVFRHQLDDALEKQSPGSKRNGRACTNSTEPMLAMCDYSGGW